MLIRRCISFCLLATTLPFGSVQAHMPWIGRDQDGHVRVWFGESPAEQAYKLPESVAKIELTTADGQKVAFEPKESDDFIGLVSRETLPKSATVVGSVTYGIYHGTKLNYHVGLLPAVDGSLHSGEFDVKLTHGAAGEVLVGLHHGDDAVAEQKVMLYAADGRQEAEATTDANGTATIAAKDVESGWNYLLIGIVDASASGQLGDQSFKSTSDYFTVTFPGKELSANKSETRSETDEDLAVVRATSLPPAPLEVTSFGAAIVDDQLFVYGGHTGRAHSYSRDEQSDQLWSIELGAGQAATWKQLAPDDRVQGHALVAHGGDLYRVGGFTAVNEAGEEADLQSQDSVRRFDVTAGTWSTLPSLPEPRSSLDAAVLGDSIYVVGGWQLAGGSDDAHWHETAYRLDLTDIDAGWQAIAQPGFQRRALTLAAYRGRLYVMGGMTADQEITQEVAVYNPADDTWTAGPALPGEGMMGFGAAACTLGAKLFVSVAGGELLQLNDAGDGWVQLACADVGRIFHEMLPHEDRLLLIGGVNMQVGKTTTIEEVVLK